LYDKTKELYPFGICGIPLRPYPLIGGPSGVGKTHLVKVWAKQQKLPLLILNSGCWYAVGSYGGLSTLSDISEFLESCQGNGVILIDEIDKFTGGSSWSNSVQQELYALLDKRLERLVGWTDQTVDLLGKAFIIGAGTWQSDYQKKGSFFNHQEVLEFQEHIPQELLYRFNVNTLFLDHLNKEVMPPAQVGHWLKAPNPTFDGSTPLQVIERGEIDRIWHMLYDLESGQPS